MGDLEYLRLWVAELRRRVSILERRREETGKAIVFTISSTSKPDINQRPYLTPRRETAAYLISGVVVRSLDQGAIAAVILDLSGGKVFVDAEGKKGLDQNHQPKLFSELEVNLPSYFSDSEMTDLVSLCRHLIRKSELRLYKPNDQTVESVWYFIEAKRKRFEKIAIIGGGNIGFKLALKLAETGYHVALNRRNVLVGESLVKAIVDILPPLSVGTIHFESNSLAACDRASLVIGATDGMPAISQKMVESSQPDCIFLDVGKGTLEPEAIATCHFTGREVYRTDITSGLEGFLAGMSRSDQIIEYELGRREFSPGISIVSGGYLGELGDVIVDNYLQPKHIVGVADGRGDLIRVLTQDQEAKVRKLKQQILDQWDQILTV